jgi:hypothetical protein
VVVRVVGLGLDCWEDDFLLRHLAHRDGDHLLLLTAAAEEAPDALLFVLVGVAVVLRLLRDDGHRRQLG